MKKIYIISIAGYIVAAILIILFARSVNTNRTSQPLEMPPEWHLETDGEEWRWVDPQGYSWLPLRTKNRAIENAWDHYDYRNRTNEWRRINHD